MEERAIKIVEALVKRTEERIRETRGEDLKSLAEIFGIGFSFGKGE